MASDRRMWMVSSPIGTCYLAHKDTGKIKWLAEFIYIACKGDDASKRFNMMPPSEANPLNQFILTSNLYETNKKIKCLATAVVIAEEKHNMSIIEGTYDKIASEYKLIKRISFWRWHHIKSFASLEKLARISSMEHNALAAIYFLGMMESGGSGGERLGDRERGGYRLGGKI
nr:hypothetical protein [Tanacetum cinerariifolium]